MHLFAAYFVLHTSQSGWKISSSEKYLLNNFYVNLPIATKFSEPIWTLMVIVFTKHELFCIQINIDYEYI